MKPPFRLLTLDSVSHDTVSCLRALLEKAESGEVIGVAYAAMYKRRRYTVHTCGEAFRNPTFTLGMAHMLIDDLSDKVRSGA